MRFHFSLTAALIVVLLAVAPRAEAQAATQPARRPNIVFLLIDDMGYADLSCYGQKKISTPQVDRMAREGVRFTQFYVNAPICSPSRAALLTGQYPARWRITSYLAERKLNGERGMAQWLDVKAPSVARALHDAGYTTGHFGKWHLGGQRDVGDAPLITEYGFDTSITSFEGLGDRYLPLLDAFDGRPAKKYSLGSDNLGRGKITWIDRSKMTAAYRDAAVAFIKSAREQDKPFYVNLWLDDVHSPFFPPAALRGDEAKRTLYLGVVKAMDDQLAVFFDTIRNDPKLRDNTIVVIASDNGPEPGAGSAGVFRGTKGNLYEGGIREPLIVWGPGVLPNASAGTTDDASVIAGIDLYPTLLALAGVKPAADAAFDGVSRAEAFTGHPTATRGKPLFWLRPPDRPGPDRAPWPDLATRDGDWKLLTDYAGDHPQLYDLRADPTESNNLADREPAVVDRLRKALVAWYQTMPDAQRKR